MNRLPIVLAAALLLPSLATTQPSSIRIRQGEGVEYAVTAAIELTELAGGHAEIVRAETDGIARLKARRVTRGRIEWSYETPEIRLIRVTSTMEPGATDETTVQSKPGRISTDARGRMMSDAGRSKGPASLASMLEALHRNLVKHWFQPAIFRKMKPGDTWSEKRDERIRVDALGIDVRTRYTVDYRFDGIVDTLGIKAIRVTWNAGRMEIAGTRTIGGVASPVKGDGDHEGTSYFSTIDGLLLSGKSANTVDIRVTAPDSTRRVIPMTWRMRSESIRR